MLFFAGLGLPGLCGFIGEVFVVLSAWNYSPALAIVAATGVILTAGYILWTMQRVYLGAEYKGPHEDEITPMNAREATVGFVILGMAILLGVCPFYVFDMMDASMSSLVDAMSAGLENSQAVGDPVTLTK